MNRLELIRIDRSVNYFILIHSFERVPHSHEGVPISHMNMRTQGPHSHGVPKVMEW